MPKDENKLHFFLILAAILLIAVLILSAYAFKPSYPEVDYNGHKFVKKDGMWFTDVKQGKGTVTLAFKLNPYEVEGVPVTGAFDANFLQEKTYVTQNVGNQSTRYEVLGAIELITNIREGLGKTLVTGCASNDTFSYLACKKLPAVSCNTSKERVIFYRPYGSANITFHENCLIISGKDFEMQKAVDKLLYMWLDIMEQK